MDNIVLWSTAVLDLICLIISLIALHLIWRVRKSIGPITTITVKGSVYASDGQPAIAVTPEEIRLGNQQAP
jgi:hypothetical protein